jgi:hypothetical protein
MAARQDRNNQLKHMAIKRIPTQSNVFIQYLKLYFASDFELQWYNFMQLNQLID